MVEPQSAREVRRRLAILQHVEDVSGNVSMACRHYGISQPVYSTRLRRYRERASTTTAVMPIRPGDSHAIKTHFRLAQSSRSVIVRLGRHGTGDAPTRLGVMPHQPERPGHRHDQLGLRGQEHHQRLTQRPGLRLVDHRLTVPLPERRLRTAVTDLGNHPAANAERQLGAPPHRVMCAFPYATSRGPVALIRCVCVRPMLCRPGRCQRLRASSVNAARNRSRGSASVAMS